jgi:hypothetical protein
MGAARVGKEGPGRRVGYREQIINAIFMSYDAHEVVNVQHGELRRECRHKHDRGRR